MIEFIETFCRYPEGPLTGELVRLALWQRQLLLDVFELRSDGLRRFRQGLIGMPRKNSKSTLGSGIALYLLLMDGELGAQVYSCAGDKDQARIVFGTAKKLVEMDPELSEAVKVYKDAIEHRPTGSVYRVLSADAPTKEGLNPSGVLFDEVHVQPKRDLWDVMTQGSGTRLQPLILGITTAGADKDGSICGELYEYGRKIRSGQVEDERFFFRWWEPLDPNCDYRDPAVWAEANPALGDFLRIEDLQDAALRLPEPVFRRYRLNQWTRAGVGWLPYGAWDACSAPELDLDPSLPLRVAIDVGLRHDSAAVVCAQKLGERTVVRARVWENPYPQGHSLRDGWKLNIFELETYLRELHATYRIPACEIDGAVKPGPEYVYDPAFFERSAQLLEGDGLAMVEFPQTDSRMIPASQRFYQLIAEGNLAHNGDPVLKTHVENAIADQKPRGWRLSKPRGSRLHIDAAIACAMASYRAQEPIPQLPASVYQERGVIVL